MAREMKDSGIEWIGEIPADWNVVRIKYIRNNEVDSFQDGDWIESPYITDNGIRYLTTGNVGDGVFKQQGNGYISEETFSLLNCKYAYPNDLVISRLNEPYGRACILPYDEEKYVLAVDIVILRTNNDKRYLCYLMQCEGYQNKVQDSAKGTTMKRISRTNLGNIALPMAPKDKQKTIADYLDTECSRIDSVIEQTRVSIEEYKKLKQAVITQAVTKGIRPDRQMKDSGIEWIGEIPVDWNRVKLKYYSTIRSGITLGKVYPAGTELFEYPYLRVANVQGSHTDLSDVAVIKVTAEEAIKYRLQSGELLMTEGGDRDKLGRGSVWHAEIDPCLHQNHVFALRTNEDRLLAEYLSYITDSYVGRDYFDVTANQSVHLASTNSTTIMDFMIPFPSIEEQKEIVAYLDKKVRGIDVCIEQKYKLISELDSYKKSLIYEYVTGKKEVI